MTIRILPVEIGLKILNDLINLFRDKMFFMNINDHEVSSLLIRHNINRIEHNIKTEVHKAFIQLSIQGKNVYEMDSAVHGFDVIMRMLFPLPNVSI